MEQGRARSLLCLSPMRKSMDGFKNTLNKLKRMTVYAFFLAALPFVILPSVLQLLLRKSFPNAREQ